MREGGKLQKKVDSDFNEVNREIFDHPCFIGLTIDVLLKILVVVFTKQLQEAERSLQYITNLPPLLSSRRLISLRVLVAVLLVVVEADADQTAFYNSGDVLEDDVLMVSLEDFKKSSL